MFISPNHKNILNDINIVFDMDYLKQLIHNHVFTGNDFLKILRFFILEMFFSESFQRTFPSFNALFGFQRTFYFFRIFFLHFHNLFLQRFSF